MSQAQAAALHALVHPRSSTPGSRWARRDRALDAVWAGTMAALLALAVVSLDSGTAFVAAENHLHAIVAARTSAITAVARQVSMAHQQVAHEQVTRPSATRQSATRQSMTRQSMGQS